VTIPLGWEIQPSAGKETIMTQQEPTKARTLAEVVATLKVVEAVGHRNLTLVSLQGEGRRHLDYILVTEAISDGTLTVTEVDESGSVPELLAVNSGEKVILLLDGEELIGAKQNRILNTTILLKPKSRTKIPVSCVEQGRWRHTSREFASGHYSPSSLRAHKSRGVTASLRQHGRAQSNQGEVWDDVAHCITAAGAPAPTMAMRDVVEHRRNSLDKYVAALPYPDGACGVIAAIDSTFVAGDIFDRPDTLERIWPRLTAGYAMDAIGRGKEKPGRFSTKAAGVLLEHVGEIECTPCPSVGMGKDWRFEAEDVVGQALMAKGVCVHLCAFPNDNAGGRESTGPRILPPSRRRRRRYPQPPDDVVH